jgi:hypothetical protein
VRIFWGISAFLVCISSAQAAGWTVEEANTHRVMDTQIRDQESHAGNFRAARGIEAGRVRAREMVSLIKDQEVKARMAELRPIGERIVNNEYIQTPAKVIAAGAAIWMGRSVSLIYHGNLRVESRVEARSRLGSLSIQSSVVNSAIEVRAGSGMVIDINRTIPLIASVAEFYYNTNDQTMRAAMSKAIFNHVVLSVGTAGLANAREGNAQLAYSVVL